MKRIACAMLACLSLLSACGSDSTTTPTATPEKPATIPAESPKPLPEAPKAPAESPKPPAEAPKPPVESPKPPVESPKPPAESPKPAANVDMDADIKVLMAKPEQPDASIEIQHVLISFQGAGVPGATRTKDEAKVLAQKVYAEAIGGSDFLALVKQHTNDSAPGIYSMTQAGRAGMVKSFGDVGWRLKVGEIGVAPWDAASSPYGWHIIKRLK